MLIQFTKERVCQILLPDWNNAASGFLRHSRRWRCMQTKPKPLSISIARNVRCARIGRVPGCRDCSRFFRAARRGHGACRPALRCTARHVTAAAEGVGQLLQVGRRFATTALASGLQLMQGFSGASGLFVTITPIRIPLRLRPWLLRRRRAAGARLQLVTAAVHAGATTVAGLASTIAVTAAGAVSRKLIQRNRG